MIACFTGVVVRLLCPGCNHARGVAALWGVLGLGGCDDGYHEMSGSTMGTGFRVVAGCADGLDPAWVTTVLDEVESHLSTYRHDSELSEFNDRAGNDWVAVSPMLAEIVRMALDLAALTQGSFDPTVAQAVARAGFGPPGSGEPSVPAGIGYQAIEVDSATPALRKSAPREIDLSAIAKGYAVDRIRDVLAANRGLDLMVEIGGEIAVAGRPRRGGRWRIGIEHPDPDEGVFVSIGLDEGAVATSGHYRQFRMVGGKRVSHLIDPRTGEPLVAAGDGLESVTVVTSAAAHADALATAIAVMGVERGLEFAERNGLAVLMFQRSGAGYRVRHSSAMRMLLSQ